jgi:hypothetical protein
LGGGLGGGAEGREHVRASSRCTLVKEGGGGGGHAGRQGDPCRSAAEERGER